MFSSVLIANRGEIACRIARTARRLGLRIIAVYSEADVRALFVRVADEAHLIGPAQAAESYLAIDRLISVAQRAGADCIHPGYGFLSENPQFAQACAAAGIVFVGPPAAAIRAMGLKDKAKALMHRAGIPIVPGYHGDEQDADFLARAAAEIGYPVLIKAVAGGGGKGMRRVDRAADFTDALHAAQREATAAFSDSRVLIEKYIATPRHIELQVFADRFGHCIHLHERDCTLQRRHQKVIEEAPAPGMSPELRAAMGAAATAAAQAVGYVGAGTVEFIADASEGLSAERFWFMEMNTRLQVEHPVTEAITGLDLVEWQFRIAAGEPLPLAQAQVPLVGHAVEARVYAEDPEHGFLPSTGKIIAFDPPTGEGIRIDAGVEAGSEVTPFYDPMIGKVIAHGSTRTEALDRLGAALARLRIAGPRTNLAFLIALTRAPEFRTGAFDTGFIDRNLSAVGAAPQPMDKAAAARGIDQLLRLEIDRIAALSRADAVSTPWDATDGFQLTGERTVMVPAAVDEELILAQAAFAADGLAVTVEGSSPAADALVFPAERSGEMLVLRHGRQTNVRRVDAATPDLEHGEDGAVIKAPMHGKVLALLTAAGSKVTKGQRLAIIEAMKMEHVLSAPCDGVVAEIAVSEGAQVAQNAVLMRIDSDGERE
ncbi:MAG: acetyl/propionyl/methylcrotonyl-CoA carboxylase subunit alpha [Xanthobacteraceae bacterium]